MLDSVKLWVGERPPIRTHQCLIISAGFNFSFFWKIQMNKLLTALVASFVCMGAFAQIAAPAAPSAPAVQSTPTAAPAPAKEVKKQNAAAHKAKKSKRKAKKAAK